jgi:hypothetical protein
MSAWEGKETWECDFVLPHSTKIPRKPKGIGCEVKSLADCQSMVLLRLEIMEGKERMSTKKYVDEYGATPALVKRMLEPFQGRKLTVIGDSAFSSVKTATTMLEMGLHFLGCVKTAHRAYPMQVMKAFGDDSNNATGTHTVLKTTVQSTKLSPTEIFAVGWKDSVMKSFICTRGVTLPGNPSIKYKFTKTTQDGRPHVQKNAVAVPKPSVVEEYFAGFSAVDIHDHYRQGSLAMEEGWTTRTWWHRLFTSVFGMIVTDSYLAYKYHKDFHLGAQEASMLSFKVFTERLCWSLVEGLNEDLNRDRPVRATPARPQRQELQRGEKVPALGTPSAPKVG